MMSEEAVGFKDLCISLSDVYAAMGYGDAVPDEQICRITGEVLGDVAGICSPRYMYRILPAALKDKYTVEIGDADFRTGSIIASYLDGMTGASVFVATAGVEYDSYLSEVKRQGDIVKEYVADALGSVIAEGCVDIMTKKLSASEVYPISLPYSPGYCGWKVSEQRKLFSLLPSSPCGVTLTESCLMHPVKSVSGFFAMGENLVRQPYRCDICTNKNCYKRKYR